MKIIKIIIWGFGILFVLTLLTPIDSTDRNALQRSDLGLYIDNATGCHYIKGGIFGNTIPRLDKNGNQICNGWDYENSMRNRN